MMAHLTRSVRNKNSVDYRKLHHGEILPRDILKKVKSATSTVVLPEQYLVERIISRKTSSEVRFLICH